MMSYHHYENHTSKLAAIRGVASLTIYMLAMTAQPTRLMFAHSQQDGFMILLYKKFRHLHVCGIMSLSTISIPLIPFFPYVSLEHMPYSCVFLQPSSMFIKVLVT